MSAPHRDEALLDLAQAAARGDQFCLSCSELGSAVCTLAADLDTAEAKLAQSDRKEIDRLHAIIRDLQVKNERLDLAFRAAAVCIAHLEEQLGKEVEEHEDDGISAEAFAEAVIQ